MNSVLKTALLSAAFALASTLPLAAQIDNGVDFTNPDSFYAGNVKMPAGTYRITQDNLDEGFVLVRSTDGRYSAFLDVIPTLANQPRQKTAVSFIHYGDAEYLDNIWLMGEREGLQVDPTRAERKAASAVKDEQGSSAGN
jgi:hypothetical protein